MLMMAAEMTGSPMAQANPFVGVWNLNVAKSKFAGEPAPKRLTRTVTADGAGLKYSFEGAAADGLKLSYSFTSNLDGKDSAVAGTGIPRGADTAGSRK